MQLRIIDNLQAYDEAQVMRLMDDLPPWRRDAAMRYRFLSGKRECALAYLTLCQVLKEEYGINFQPTFTYSDKGKPSLLELPELHFSMSHCSEAVGVLVDERPCGFDIEGFRKAKDALVRYTMNDDEEAAIRSADRPDEVFTMLWTRKEAVGKLHGTGIADDLKQMLSADSLCGIALQTTVCSSYIYTTARLQEE